MIALGIILAALFVIIAIFYFIFKAANAEQKAEVIIPKDTKPSESKAAYGHTFNPLIAVKNRLPKAPEGYIWELYVTNSQKDVSKLYKDCHYGQLLVLNLYSNSLSKVMISKEISISWYFGHSVTFAQHYKDFGQFGLAKKNAYNQIVLPLEAWAKDVKQQLEPNAVIGYEAIA
jgi:hypothetical protein